MNTLDFDEFVRARSGRLLRLAYALTQNHQLAEDLLQTAFTRTWPAWKRIEGDPEPYVRTVLVNTHNSWWRRRWNGERPTETLPEHEQPAPQSGVDNRDEVWRALSRLPRQQQAVLVLRYFEDLTETQIADTLSISPGAVKNYAFKGLAKLRIDPTLQTVPLPEIPETPRGTERLTGIKSQIKQRRRQRLINVAAACAVVIALIAGYATASSVRSKAFIPTEQGFPEYFNGHHLLVNLSGSLVDAPKLTARWSPPNGSYKIFASCASSQRDLRIVLTADETRLTTFGCSQGKFHPADYTAVTTTMKPPKDRQPPHQLTLTLERMLPDGKTFAALSNSEIPEGHFALATGEPVPFTQHPLPSRPAQLKPLGKRYNGLDVSQSDVLLLNAASPTGSIKGGLTYQFVATSQTPGLLRIRVNGELAHEFGWWDYGHAVKTSHRYNAPTGNLTISVEAEHMTGDWYVVIGKDW